MKVLPSVDVPPHAAQLTAKIQPTVRPNDIRISISQIFRNELNLPSATRQYRHRPRSVSDAARSRSATSETSETRTLLSELCTLPMRGGSPLAQEERAPAEVALATICRRMSSFHEVARCSSCASREGQPPAGEERERRRRRREASANQSTEKKQQERRQLC